MKDGFAVVRAALAASVAMSAMATAASGWAQELPSEELDAIVVTAQKRTEKVLDVPISISVVSGEAIQERGAAQLTDYAAFVPGLQIDNSGSPGQSNVSLRGIGPLGQSATVGIYVDDAPIGSSSNYNRGNAFTLDLLPYDIERVEVLKGPQGTLYGASTIGGLLKYVTVSPDLERTSGRVGGELFTVDHAADAGYALNGMVNLPLVDGVLGMTASIAYRSTPGYIDNVQTGEKDINSYDQVGARVAMLWKPSDALSVKLSAIWQEIESDDNGLIMETVGTPLGSGTPIGNGHATNIYSSEAFNSKFRYFAGTLDYDFGFATLTSTTAYSRIKILEESDATRLYGVIWGGRAKFPSNLDQERVTQEVRLTSSSSDRFEWMVGGYYTHESSDHFQVVHALDLDGAPLPDFDPFAYVALPNKYKEYSLFGNATYKFSDLFHLTGGLRWARNEQSFGQITSIPLFGLDIDETGASSENVVTYSLSPQFYLADDMMLYARLASGYRPGGPNPVVPGFPAAVDSDRMTNYEVGLKGQMLDRRLTLDVAVFRMDWRDLQVSQNFANGLGGLVNAGKARSQGVEGSLTWQPVRGLSLGMNAAYTDSKCVTTSAACADNARLPRIPKFTGAVTGDYRFGLTDDMEGSLGVAVRQVGARVSSVNPAEAVWADAYTTVDLNASVRYGDRWTVRAYVRNLNGSEGALTRTLSISNANSQIETALVQPRTFGLALDAQF